VEAGIETGSPHPPGGPDGGSCVDETPAGARFCDSQTAKRCFDFDDRTAPVVPFGFDDAELEGPVQLHADTCRASSKGRSLRVEALSGGEIQLTVKTGAQLAFARVKLAIAVDRVDAATSTSAHFVTVKCASTGDAQVFVKLTKNAKIAIVQEGGPDPAEEATPVSGVFTAVALSLQRGAGATYDVELAVNGKRLTGFTSTPITCDAEGMDIEIGGEISGGTGSDGDYVFNLDDVTVDYD
jgi:hypothetical protein